MNDTARRQIPYSYFTFVFLLSSVHEETQVCTGTLVIHVYSLGLYGGKSLPCINKPADWKPSRADFNSLASVLVPERRHNKREPGMLSFLPRSQYRFSNCAITDPAEHIR